MQNDSKARLNNVTFSFLSNLSGATCWAVDTAVYFVDQFYLSARSHWEAGYGEQLDRALERRHHEAPVSSIQSRLYFSVRSASRYLWASTHLVAAIVSDLADMESAGTFSHTRGYYNERGYRYPQWTLLRAKVQSMLDTVSQQLTAFSRLDTHAQSALILRARAEHKHRDIHFMKALVDRSPNTPKGLLLRDAVMRRDMKNTEKWLIENGYYYAESLSAWTMMKLGLAFFGGLTFSFMQMDLSRLGFLGRYGALTPLHIAVSQNDIPMVALLRAYGAPLEAVDESGFTPIMLAAVLGHWELVEELIIPLAYEDEQSVEQDQYQYRRVLALATEAEKGSIMQALVEAGAGTVADINAAREERAKERALEEKTAAIEGLNRLVEDEKPEGVFKYLLSAKPYPIITGEEPRFREVVAHSYYKLNAVNMFTSLFASLGSLWSEGAVTPCVVAQDEDDTDLLAQARVATMLRAWSVPGSVFDKALDDIYQSRVREQFYLLEKALVLSEQDAHAKLVSFLKRYLHGVEPFIDDYHHTPRLSAFLLSMLQFNSQRSDKWFHLQLKLIALVKPLFARGHNAVEWLLRQQVKLQDQFHLKKIRGLLAMSALSDSVSFEVALDAGFAQYFCELLARPVIPAEIILESRRLAHDRGVSVYSRDPKKLLCYLLQESMRNRQGNEAFDTLKAVLASVLGTAHSAAGAEEKMNRQAASRDADDAQHLSSSSATTAVSPTSVCAARPAERHAGMRFEEKKRYIDSPVRGCAPRQVSSSGPPSMLLSKGREEGDSPHNQESTRERRKVCFAC